MLRRMRAAAHKPCCLCRWPASGWRQLAAAVEALPMDATSGWFTDIQCQLERL